MAKKSKQGSKKKVQNTSGAPLGNPDHTRQLPKLNRVEGQLAGIKKMIEERRYCPDIIQQVRATRKALFSIEAALLESHLNNCVTEAIESKIDSEKEEKLFEVMQVFKSADSQGIEF